MRGIKEGIILDEMGGRNSLPLFSLYMLKIEAISAEFSLLNSCAGLASEAACDSTHYLVMWNSTKASAVCAFGGIIAN